MLFFDEISFVNLIWHTKTTWTLRYSQPFSNRAHLTHSSTKEIITIFVFASLTIAEKKTYKQLSVRDIWAKLATLNLTEPIFPTIYRTKLNEILLRVDSFNGFPLIHIYTSSNQYNAILYTQYTKRNIQKGPIIWFVFKEFFNLYDYKECSISNAFSLFIYIVWCIGTW